MKKRLLFVVALPLLLMQTVQASTPKDTLVMAFSIDEIVSLDPAEIFEFANAEYAANAYDRLINYDVDHVSEIYPGIAERWEISDDGLTYKFKIRKGVAFASGNTLSADDVVFSLRRVVLLDKSPAFILTQFGFTPENVAQTITKVDDYTVKIIVDQAYPPLFFSLLPDLHSHGHRHCAGHSPGHIFGSKAGQFLGSCHACYRAVWPFSAYFLARAHGVDGLLCPA